MDNNYFVTIMAGGIGSRFWPASTEEIPKQFLDILGVGKSLIRLTFERFLKVVPAERILVITNKKYKDLTIQHIPEIPKENILCEPSRNNTGPCVAYSAFHLIAKNPDAVFVTAPSDHVILKEEEFINKISNALYFVSTNNAIVTLGIIPTRPDTGYGYIEVPFNQQINISTNQKPLQVTKFKEKPDLKTAHEYLAAGNYFWNAGIFIWKASQLLESFKKNATDIYDILNQEEDKFGSSLEQDYIDKVYPDTPNISVDYAILEKADNVYVIPADIGWSDLGTWNSLHAYLEKDENETVTLGKNTYLFDTKNSIIRSDSEKVVVIKGLENYIVIDEKDALLIYPKSDEQEIKEVVNNLIE